MHQPFDTTHYVLEYGSSGNVWIEPPGQYDTSYNPTHGSFNACAAVCEVTTARDDFGGVPVQSSLPDWWR
jgi:hypothetical protein